MNEHREAEYQQAIELQELADQGDQNAQNQLGLRYQYGRGVQKDYEQAEAFFRLSAAQGNQHAQSNLHSLYKIMGITPEGIQKKILEVNALNSGRTKNLNTPINYAPKETSSNVKDNSSEIQSKNDFNSADKDENGWTPLHYAARYNNLFVVSDLIDNRGVEVDPLADDWVTPLHFAASEGHLEIAKSLIAKGANVESIRIDIGYSPLHCALDANRSNVAKYLIVECNVNVHKLSEFGYNPLALAMLNNNDEVIEILLERRARFEPHYKIIESLKTIENSAKIYKLILTKGIFSQECDFRSQTLDYRHSFFVEAALSTESEEMMRSLLEIGFDPNFRFCNATDPDTLKLLCNRESQKTILIRAIEKNYPKIVEILLNAKANPDLKDADNITGLLISVKNGNQQIFNDLLNFGANVNLSDKNGTTPLLLAVTKGNLHMVNALMEKGADPNQANKTGITPLSEAQSLGNQQILDALKKHDEKYANVVNYNNM
jgi:ankyrin repeat protein